jgi:hypothetical protein
MAAGGFHHGSLKFPSAIEPHVLTSRFSNLTSCAWETGRPPAPHVPDRYLCSGLVEVGVAVDTRPNEVVIFIESLLENIVSGRMLNW